MDREEIERGDFPIGRRGYDPAAVDAHLRRVADEFEHVRVDAPPPAPMSAGTSEQVRLILEAAEHSAAELRGEAGRDAEAHVERVGEAADAMLSRLDQLQTELGALLDGLRASGERLTEGLGELHSQVSRVGPPAPEPAAPEPEPEPEEDFAAAAPAPVSDTSDDEAGARITALNMALGGTSREETAAYLAEHYTLADPEALLDDVYDKAGG